MGRHRLLCVRVQRSLVDGMLWMGSITHVHRSERLTSARSSRGPGPLLEQETVRLLLLDVALGALRGHLLELLCGGDGRPRKPPARGALEGQPLVLLLGNLIGCREMGSE